MFEEKVYNVMLAIKNFKHIWWCCDVLVVVLMVNVCLDWRRSMEEIFRRVVRCAVSHSCCMTAYWLGVLLDIVRYGYEWSLLWGQCVPGLEEVNGGHLQEGGEVCCEP